jgi:hypothetical protein
LVWAAGITGALVTGGVGDTADRVHTLSGQLLSPAYQWDAGWFVGLAQHGYGFSTLNATAYFPLYPLLVRVVGEPIGALGFAGTYAYQLGGVLVALAAFLVALYLLHRLTELELGQKAADNAVVFLALFPTSFFFSAIYAESLFLALAIGCVYAARTGSWWWAGALGGLAVATRSQGIVLLLPLVIMLWYGPRGDRGPLFARRSSRRTRYLPNPREIAPLLLVPLGVISFMGYVRLTTTYGLMAPFKAQALWGRGFEGPFMAAWDGAQAAYRGVRDLFAGAPVLGDFAYGVGTRTGPLDFSALVFAAIGLVGVFLRLPVAYGAFALGVLIISISFPIAYEPLYSLLRFVIVLFPIFMWAGLAMIRPATRNLVLGISAAGLALLSALFASGYWIA